MPPTFPPSLLPTPTPAFSLTLSRDGKDLGIPLLPQVVQLGPSHALLALVDVGGLQHLFVCFGRWVDGSRVCEIKYCVGDSFLLPFYRIAPNQPKLTLRLLMKGL